MTSQPSVDDLARTGTLSRWDRVRRDWYLFRLDWAMQDYPRKEFRRIKKDLHAELTLAAMDVGMTTALAGVGHPRALAERYTAELGRRLPRWATGAVVAGLTVSVLLYLMMAYTFGALDTLDALGGGTVTFELLGATTTLTHTAEEISAAANLSWGWAALYAGVAVVSFLLSARVWRAF